MSDDVGEQLGALFERLAHLEGIVERMHRPGTVTDVDYSDATKPRARLQIGVDADGQPVKGPWAPIASHAGDRAIHAPITIGQQMLQIAPDGNFENALLVHYGFSQKVPSPSTDANTHVDQLGKTKITMQDGTLVQEVNNASISYSDGKLYLKASSIVLEGEISLGAEGASRELALRGSIDSAGDVEQSNLSTKVKAV